jgi:hypothetical protein
MIKHASFHNKASTQQGFYKDESELLRDQQKSNLDNHMHIMNQFALDDND